MYCLFAASLTELVKLQFVLFLFTAHFVIVFVFALRANQRDCHSFSCHLVFPLKKGSFAVRSPAQGREMTPALRQRTKHAKYYKLLNNFGYYTSAYGVAAFADSEA